MLARYDSAIRIYIFIISSSSFKCQPHKMVKHTQTFCQIFPKNSLNVFDHFVGLALKGLNLLRPNFLNIYNLPFLCCRNFGKIRVKIGPLTNFFYFFFIDMQPTKRQTKVCPRFCSFQIFFEQSTFKCFHAKYVFKTLRVIAIKSE